MLRFSFSTSGFYEDAEHGDNIPADAVQVSAEERAALLAGQSCGQVIVKGADGRPELQDAPPPPIEAQFDTISRALQAELERQAKANRYDSLISACSYAAQPVGAPFQAEGAAFLAWRSAVWHEAGVREAAIRAGTEAMPTPEQAVALMPALVLPQ